MTRDELRQAIDRLAYTYFENHVGEITSREWAIFARAAIETFVTDELRAPELDISIALLREKVLQAERTSLKEGRQRAYNELLELLETTELTEAEQLGFVRAKDILKAVMT